MLSIIFLLILCLVFGFGNAEEPGCYLVRRVNSQSQEDDYFLGLDREIWQYSVSGQQVINVYGNGESIDGYAIDDDYIFMAVNAWNTVLEEGLWKFDRRTGEWELFSNKKHCVRLSVADGFLFYGIGERNDVYVCPVDGNLENDSISLLAQFEEDGSKDWWQETVFGGWRVQRIYDRGYYIASVTDAESGEVIVDFPGLYPGAAGVAVDGEWLVFTNAGNNFYYQKTPEEEMHKIECLEDKKYEYSWIIADNLTVEGKKVIGLMTVSKNHLVGGFLPQEDIRNDLLFEINLEDDTSRILYSTKNCRTRIIGYKAGIVYLFKDGVIYRETLEGTDREELLDLQAEGWDFYEQTIHFDWQGDNLMIWGVQEGEVRIESLPTGK